MEQPSKCGNVYTSKTNLSVEPQPEEGRGVK